MSYILGFFIVFIGVVWAYHNGYDTGYQRGRDDGFNNAWDQNRKDDQQ
jgi:hypothetical protein